MILRKLIMLLVAIAVVISLFKFIFQPAILGAFLVFAFGWFCVAALVGWQRNPTGGLRAAGQGGLAGVRWLTVTTTGAVGAVLRTVFRLFAR